ncbi:MAG: hypothetical protein ACE5JI_11390 [Acidobacteriota bacterium]
MRGGPRSLRIALTIVLVAIGTGALALLARALILGPPGPRTPFEEEIDGGDMEQYLESADEKKALLRWVAGGPTEDAWKDVEPILEAHCVSCHDGFSMPDLVPLDQYEPAARLASVRPLLAEKIEWGSMEKYLEGPGEKEKILSWIESGAPESEWQDVKPILAERCVSCHNPLGVPGLVALDRYPSVARIAAVPPVERPPASIAAPIGVGLIAAAALYQMWGRRTR